MYCMDPSCMGDKSLIRSLIKALLSSTCRWINFSDALQYRYSHSVRSLGGYFVQLLVILELVIRVLNSMSGLDINILKYVNSGGSEEISSLPENGR